MISLLQHSHILLVGVNTVTLSFSFIWVWASKITSVEWSLFFLLRKEQYLTGGKRFSPLKQTRLTN